MLGDSLTAGWGLADPGRAFPAVLARALAARGFACTVIDAGVSGDTSAGALARLDWVLADRPTHLLVEIGGNDALRGLPVAAFARNLEAIVARARARGVAFFLLGVEAPRNWGEDYVRAFRRAWREVARRHGVPLDPFFLAGAWGVPGRMQADGIHPTAEGVRAIVERLLPDLVRWLEATGVRPERPPAQPRAESRRVRSSAATRRRRAASARISAASRASWPRSAPAARARRSRRHLRAPRMV